MRRWYMVITGLKEAVRTRGAVDGRRRYRTRWMTHHTEVFRTSGLALSLIDVIANETGVAAPPCAAEKDPENDVGAPRDDDDTGVPARVPGLLRLCAMWLLTR